MAINEGNNPFATHFENLNKEANLKRTQSMANLTINSKDKKSKSDQSSVMDTSEHVTPTDKEASYSPLFIFREDKAIIPINFVSSALLDWENLTNVKNGSITRVGQGFSLRCLYPTQLGVPPTFQVGNVKYMCRKPSTPEMHLGEISMYLTDESDLKLLEQSDSQLASLIEIPSSQGLINVKSVKRTFPKRSSEEHTSGGPPRLMKCIIGFSCEIPQYISFQRLVVRVAKYTPPPTRCFRCQRYGHGSLTCRRSEFCSKCGNKGHSNRNCTSEIWKCASCKGNHGSGSPKCKYFSLASDVLQKFNSGEISRDEAVSQYLKLYNPSAPTISRLQSEVTPSANISSNNAASDTPTSSQNRRDSTAPSTSNVKQTMKTASYASKINSPPATNIWNQIGGNKKKKTKSTQPNVQPNFQQVYSEANTWANNNSNPSSNKTSRGLDKSKDLRSNDSNEDSTSGISFNLLSALKEIIKNIIPFIVDLLKSADHPLLQVAAQFLDSLNGF